MSILTRLSSQFTSTILARGRSYFARGLARIVRSDEESLEAEVRGTERYRVRLVRDGASLVVSCSCPYVEAYGDVCKHVVAAILEAEAQGLEAVAGDIRYVDIDEEYDEEYEGEDGEEEDEDGGPRELVYEYFEPPSGLAPRPEGRTVGRWGRRPPRPAGSQSRVEERRPDWRQQLALARKVSTEATARPRDWPERRRVLYVFDVPKSTFGRGVAIEVSVQDLKKNGEWGVMKSQRISRSDIPRLPDPLDRQILAMLAGGLQDSYSPYGYYGYTPDAVSPQHYLSSPLASALFPLMGRTGRLLARVPSVSLHPYPVTWDDGPPWELWLEVRPVAAGGSYEVTGSLRRGGERRPLEEPVTLLGPSLFVVDRDRVSAFDDGGAFGWAYLLRNEHKVSVPREEAGALLGELFGAPARPRLDLPDELRLDEVAPVPLPTLKVKAPERHRPDALPGELLFDYDGVLVPETREGPAAADVERRRLVARNPGVERAAAARLTAAGFAPRPASPAPVRELPSRRLPAVVRQLVGEGWRVEAEGRLYRRPGAVRVEVTSGIDWFDLGGVVDYGETSVSLPALLEAARRGEKMVQLDDGTFGLLPEEWLETHGALAGLGRAEGGRVRFSRGQVGLLDALLAAQPEARVDRTFARARDELRRFAGVEPADPPKGFEGELREYQREGLGWLHFLRRFDFGGCLADDMGLGKTVQVLALLEGRRANRPGRRPEPPLPSLVVVPRSLVFNWKLEAARFTPKLRVRDHTGAGRATDAEAFRDADLVVTTYGVLRRDAALFAGAEFDYVILDESQAIKNAATESAKAARLLKGRHRLALSGTPVENHLGELWSLFEFLNPGLLGAASAFQRLGAGRAEPESRAALARALRPFILRRTKAQVAKDLPPKTEQTIYCEMEPAQRKLYEQLRRYYRESLLRRVESEGIGRSKIQILEALLRLRQAACHPGLVDQKRVSEPSAKLDALLLQVGEVLEEGHKVLVFSQFTKMLAIVRDRLDRDGVAYEYLDGRTRDRAARVGRFQNDPERRLFLISLKAGGLGLNLTAADYVFLLDPWWNPAVEAQAVDRAYRIGQTRSVFAYRLIARETVEEKVLQLQETKRELADAIVNADNSLIRGLSGEDLALLLS